MHVKTERRDALRGATTTDRLLQAVEPPALGRHDRILHLNDLDIPMSIGIHDAERSRPQVVRVSLSVFIRPPCPAHGDDIALVLDYEQLHQGAKRIMCDGHINLQETLAERLAAMCFTWPEVYAVRVYVEKPEAFADCRSVGCEIFRSRTATPPQSG